MTSTATLAARVAEVRVHDKDTGSCDVQITLLTERIGLLTSHLSSRPRDNSTRRGLLKLVGRRNRLLRYLQRTNRPRYERVVEKLGIRGIKPTV
ncbi:MAG: 30S ribosomal protein S15 [Planctomycetota bacterium]